jgi:SPP1 family predicted phage head-tail adaptor
MFLRPVQARNDCNELVTSFESDVYAWAEVNQSGGDESEKGKQIHSSATYQVRMRFNSTLARTWRLRHGSVDLEIVTMVDTGDRHEELVLTCKEVQ